MASDKAPRSTVHVETLLERELHKPEITGLSEKPGTVVLGVSEVIELGFEPLNCES